MNTRPKRSKSGAFFGEWFETIVMQQAVTGIERRFCRLPRRKSAATNSGAEQQLSSTSIFDTLPASYRLYVQHAFRCSGSVQIGCTRGLLSPSSSDSSSDTSEQAPIASQLGTFSATEPIVIRVERRRSA